MSKRVCEEKSTGCGKCEKHICLEDANGNYVGLRIAQMAIMQGMTENKDNPDIMAGLSVALTKVSERIIHRDGD